jgi:arginine:ornithine antiporter/lysine permease
MPRFLGRQNGAGAPVAALVMTSLMIQALIVVVLFSEDALNFLLDLCTSLSLIPYFLAAAYALKLALERKSEGVLEWRPLLIGALATIYTVFLVYAAGPEFLLLSCIIYAPGTVLYLRARREARVRWFRPYELALCGVLLLGATAGIIALATGGISI